MQTRGPQGDCSTFSRASRPAPAELPASLGAAFIPSERQGSSLRLELAPGQAVQAGSRCWSSSAPGLPVPPGGSSWPLPPPRSQSRQPHPCALGR